MGGGGSGSGGAASGSGGAGGGSGGQGDCVPDYNCAPTAAESGYFHADCVARVNQFRACLCLGPLERWTEAESCADQQAEYDSTRGAHAGFRDDICSPSGLAQVECPGTDSSSSALGRCMQMMFDEGPGPEGCADDPGCFQEHGHHLSIASTTYTRVACGIYTTGSGEVWALGNFR